MHNIFITHAASKFLIFNKLGLRATFNKTIACLYLDLSHYYNHTKLYMYVYVFASHCNIFSKFVYLLVYILNTMISVYNTT